MLMAFICMFIHSWFVKVILSALGNPIEKTDFGVSFVFKYRKYFDYFFYLLLVIAKLKIRPSK